VPVPGRHLLVVVVVVVVVIDLEAAPSAFVDVWLLSPSRV
jgi:hypothetical protein